MLLLHYLDFKVLGLAVLFYIQRGKVFEFGLAEQKCKTAHAQKSQNSPRTGAQIGPWYVPLTCLQFKGRD